MVETNKLITKINSLLRHGVLSKFQSDKVGAIRQRLVSFLELKKSGHSDSAYPHGGVMKTLKGDTLTIRVGNHHANEANFRAKYNVSIVIGNDIVITETVNSNVFCEYVYDSECFSEENKEECLTEIFKGLLSVLKEGRYASGRMGKCVVRCVSDVLSDSDDEEGALGAIDREELKKSIIDAVTTSLLEWEKPWRPFNGFFYKVNGKVTSLYVNAYSLKKYEIDNIARLENCMYLINSAGYGTFAPIFVTEKMAEQNGWHRIVERVPIPRHEGHTADTWFRVVSNYWQLLKAPKNQREIDDCQMRIDGGFTLKPGYIERDGKFYRLTKKYTWVTPAENIKGNPFHVERVEAEKRQMTEYIENIIKAYSANVAPVFFDQSDRCFYNPSSDEIHLVPPEAFENINEFYSTRFHETVHSTLHKSRLNRSFPNQRGFGSDGYAMEELVAEMGAWIMCSEFGISFCPKDKTQARDNSTAYVGGWLKQAKHLYNDDEEKTIIEAYRHACKAVDYILKGVNFDDMIPESIKQLEDETLSDVVLFADKSVRVVNVRRDSKIRFFFSEPPADDVKAELKEAKFHYSGIFKAWQIANTAEGEETAKRIITDVLGKSITPTPAEEDEGLRIAIAKARAMWLSLQPMLKKYYETKSK